MSSIAIGIRDARNIAIASSKAGICTCFQLLNTDLSTVLNSLKLVTRYIR